MNSFIYFIETIIPSVDDFNKIDLVNIIDELRHEEELKNAEKLAAEGDKTEEEK